MPCDGQPVAVCDAAFAALRRDITRYQGRGLVAVLGDLNARVGKAAVPYDHIGMHGEPTANGNGVRLRQLLEATDLYAANGRRACAQPQWTRCRRDQRSILDYVLVEASVVPQLQPVYIDSTDIASSDHFLVFTDLLFRTHLRASAPKRVALYRWRHEALLNETRETLAEQCGGGIARFVQA
jgi:hypothetical protein